MTMLQSASGTRVDCDECAHHAVVPSVRVEVLRRTTGYVSHDGRDFCPACWYRHTASRFRGSSDPPSDDGPAAA
jgi:hypothetical protein